MGGRSWTARRRRRSPASSSRSARRARPRTRSPAARRRCASTSSPCVRSSDDLVDTAGTGATTRTRSTSRPRPRWSPPLRARRGQARQSRHLVAVRLSGDVLEALGFELELPPERIAQSIDDLGFGFLFAPTHHPAMRHAAQGAARPGDADGLQRAQAADEPGGSARAGARRLLAGARADDRGCRLRSSAGVRGARCRRDRRALAVGRGTPCAKSSTATCATGDRPLDLGVARCRAEELRGGTPAGRAVDSRGLRRRGQRRRDDPLQRRRGDRRGRTRPRHGRRPRAWRARRSTRAQRRRDSTSWWPSHEAMGRFRTALSEPGLGGIAEVKRRSSAGDLPTRSRSRGAGAGVRARRSGRVLDPRGRALRRVVGGPPGRAYRVVAAATGERFFSSSGTLRTARDAGADAVLLLLRDLDDRRASELLDVAARARPRRAGRGTRPEELARAERLGAGDRRQRARPRDVRDRPAHAARPGCTGSARPRHHRGAGGAHARKRPRPGSPAPALVLVRTALMRRRIGREARAPRAPAREGLWAHA